jgi:hypothetical protein
MYTARSLPLPVLTLSLMTIRRILKLRTTQNNRIRMFKTTNSVLEDNKAAWTAMAPFADAAQKFRDKTPRSISLRKNGKRVL